MLSRFSPEPRVAVAAVLVAVGLVLIALSAQARDVDGRYANSPHHGWFKQLRNQEGTLCCDGADGVRVSDPDWRTENGKYQVRLKGQWIDVPDAALVTEPNRIGQTMVWPYEVSGQTLIRCFMPGAMT